MNAVVAVDLSADAIGQLFQRAHGSHQESVQCLIEAGRRLREVKRDLSHGEWGSWVQNNRDHLGFGYSTARRLLNAAANCASTRILKDDEAAEINRRIWGNLASEPTAPKLRTPVIAAPMATLPSETDRLLTALELAWAYFRDRDPCDTPRTPEALRLAQRVREWLAEWENL